MAAFEMRREISDEVKELVGCSDFSVALSCPEAADKEDTHLYDIGFSFFWIVA